MFKRFMSRKVGSASPSILITSDQVANGSKPKNVGDTTLSLNTTYRISGSLCFAGNQMNDRGIDVFFTGFGLDEAVDMHTHHDFMTSTNNRFIYPPPGAILHSYSVSGVVRTKKIVGGTPAINLWFTYGPVAERAESRLIPELTMLEWSHVVFTELSS